MQIGIVVVLLGVENFLLQYLIHSPQAREFRLSERPTISN